MTPSITTFYVISRHVLPLRRRAIYCCYRTATVHTCIHPHSDQAVTVDQVLVVVSFRNEQDQKLISAILLQSILLPPRKQTVTLSLRPPRHHLLRGVCIKTQLSRAGPK
eukprot:scaffold5384_cov73-Skeletonema_dohrnii-CCMP3373.AAC.4